jgi:hypothetical protein
MLTLLDNPALRQRTAAEGVARAASLLRWDEERKRLIAAFETVLAPPAQPVGCPAARPASNEDLDRAPAV